MMIEYMNNIENKNNSVFDIDEIERKMKGELGEEIIQPKKVKDMSELFG